MNGDPTCLCTTVERASGRCSVPCPDDWLAPAGDASLTRPQAPCCTFCGGPLPRHGRSTTYCSPPCKRKAASRRAKARKPLVPPPPPIRCIPCDKRACPSEAAARAAKRAVEDRTGRTNDVRYYRCPEGWWHWTRVEADLDGWRARRQATA